MRVRLRHVAAQAGGRSCRGCHGGRGRRRVDPRGVRTARSGSPLADRPCSHSVANDRRQARQLHSSVHQSPGHWRVRQDPALLQRRGQCRTTRDRVRQRPGQLTTRAAGRDAHARGTQPGSWRWWFLWLVPRNLSWDRDLLGGIRLSPEGSVPGAEGVPQSNSRHRALLLSGSLTTDRAVYARPALASTRRPRRGGYAASTASSSSSVSARC